CEQACPCAGARFHQNGGFFDISAAQFLQAPEHRLDELAHLAGALDAREIEFDIAWPGAGFHEVLAGPLHLEG
ncbi:MAG: hypothetical protein Q8L05_09715, partial [Actinomycetota bacterium]|nr:hypothetical protein [Actinomycetota bacterium]